ATVVHRLQDAGYAEADSCRRELLLSYFGEAYTPPCGACDVCDALARQGGGAAAAQGGGPATAPDGLPSLGARVRHPEWEEGTVSRIDAADGQVTVVFDGVGYKTLAVEVVLERGLLEEVKG
ncbi:MAG: RecQ family zinc-binding domain-containing protein, partial [Actinomycetota bacterium]|nr:RecQ family zinc-binding domain-containing protein [Actinomycetota bacterium]